VAADARLRLFCALCLPGEIVDRLARWQARELRDGRIVPPGNLHLTLAFLGHRPAGELPAIAAALREVAAGAERPRLRLRGYRETRSVAMLTFDDEGEAATALADRLQERLEELGVYRREARPWLPHVTVLRFHGDATRPRLRPTLDSLPSIVVPSDAAVFLSRLRPGGAEYESVETVALGG
jgi:RNA 2',3'-cyclic 3'-phosphodiesterase